MIHFKSSVDPHVNTDTRIKDVTMKPGGGSLGPSCGKDRSFMEAFTIQGYTSEQMKALNSCRLYAKVTSSLSEVVNNTSHQLHLLPIKGNQVNGPLTHPSNGQHKGSPKILGILFIST